MQNEFWRVIEIQAFLNVYIKFVSLKLTICIQRWMPILDFLYGDQGYVTKYLRKGNKNHLICGLLFFMTK